MPTPLQAALTNAAFAPLPDTGWLRVTGPDRVRWLNGMVTNSIQALKPGEGCYNFLLNAQGRIQADCTAWLQEDSILLETARDRIPALAALLDRFIIMDDVELEILGPPDEHHGLALIGPDAPATLTRLGLPIPEPLHMLRAGGLALLHIPGPLVPRFEIWGPQGTLPGGTLPLGALREAGLPELDPEALDHLRLLEGTPLFGVDIRERDLAQETAPASAASPALHFSKGCYLGQEIVERIRSRGQVHRLLQLFTLSTPPTTLPIPLTQDGKAIGDLTSAATLSLPTGPIHLALGIIRRESLTHPTPIQTPTGQATPTPSPYPLG